MLMCMQSLVRFCQAILKISNGNELFTERRNDGITEGQGESSIAPLFQSELINSRFCRFPDKRTVQWQSHFVAFNLASCLGNKQWALK